MRYRGALTARLSYLYTVDQGVLMRSAPILALLALALTAAPASAQEGADAPLGIALEASPIPIR